METKSFPPANALLEALSEVQYRELFHKFMDAIVTVVAFVAAVATVITQKWQQHDGTERTKAAVKTALEATQNAVEWVRNVAIPEARTLLEEGQSAYYEVKERIEGIKLNLPKAL